MFLDAFKKTVVVIAVLCRGAKETELERQCRSQRGKGVNQCVLIFAGLDIGDHEDLGNLGRRKTGA